MEEEAKDADGERDAMSDSTTSDRAAFIRLLLWLIPLVGCVIAGGYCIAYGIGLACLAVGPMTDEQRDKLHSWASCMLGGGIGFFVLSLCTLTHLFWTMWKERRNAQSAASGRSEVGHVTIDYGLVGSAGCVTTRIPGPCGFEFVHCHSKNL